MRQNLQCLRESRKFLIHDVDLDKCDDEPINLRPAAAFTEVVTADMTSVFWKRSIWENWRELLAAAESGRCPSVLYKSKFGLVFQHYNYNTQI